MSANSYSVNKVKSQNGQAVSSLLCALRLSSFVKLLKAEGGVCEERIEHH